MIPEVKEILLKSSSNQLTMGFIDSWLMANRIKYERIKSINAALDWHYIDNNLVKLPMTFHSTPDEQYLEIFNALSKLQKYAEQNLSMKKKHTLDKDEIQRFMIEYYNENDSQNISVHLLHTNQFLKIDSSSFKNIINQSENFSE